ncbi:peptide chain release factor 2 [Egibacter rhizosphaerae]|uniref:Peptide chain release factor 2 n=1 Tax=Egibacter rhizosphaerae TaxID=1670831 RepID=A0A411YC50_9ACTN|nr:peptide chain release factor 2 [Egibacter rhizosphaerae]QBI18780.1 peptide chain release factor 2 [Egibacter rhizosphaerae]
MFDVDGKRRRLTELQGEAGDPALWDDQARAQRVMTELRRLEDDLGRYDAFAQKLADLETLEQLAREENDEDAAVEVAQGVAALEREIAELELRVLLSGEYDHRDGVVTVHAGAGGTDSQDWAEMLQRMLLRWCEHRGFGVDVHDVQHGDEAGIRSATFTVHGDRAYGLLQAERGVHRLVRISPFDSQKRRHTAFASVDVIPVFEAVDDHVEVPEEELRIDTFRSSGPGGQSVNTTDSAVRINHLPTGIVVQCQDQKSQLQNKTVAMNLLKAKLAERARAERQAEIDAVRGEQADVAWGSQIRSYVLHPYQMVKDLRTGHETGNTDAVLDGDLDAFIEAFLQWKARGEQQERVGEGHV